MLNSLPNNVIRAEYAVRGAIPNRGAEIMKEIQAGSTEYSFTETTQLNIGNPQSVGQGTLSFNREVISGMMYPPLYSKGSPAIG